VEMREKLAIPEAEWPRAIEELCNLNHIEEAAVLSTCNRMEIYVVALSQHRGVKEVTEWMSKVLYLRILVCGCYNWCFDAATLANCCLGAFFVWGGGSSVHCAKREKNYKFKPGHTQVPTLKPRTLDNIKPSIQWHLPCT